MQDSSAFQFLAIDTIHESSTNPRKTFDEAKLYELAESIKHNGLIQPITVRPNNQGFEIVAGARRFRAAQIAELFSVPARIVEIDDAQSLEWCLVENSQRLDVHPYEEAQGFQRLLDMPGYDVATLVEKSGKSPSHIYARLSLLQLIPEVAEAFLEERITASHANLIARLPQESQAKAFAQCWRKDWNDAEAHLLPAKFLSSWIQNNLYLALADAPFDREDATLNPVAGACTTCPRRSGYNTALFSDVISDECLDENCYRSKISAHLDREIAAHPEFVQIETSWRSRNEQRSGVLERGEYEMLDTPENPDAEPPCPFTRTALIVYGKRVGTTVSVCTEGDCPVHNPTEAAPEPVPGPVTIQQPEAEPVREETEEEATERQQEAELLGKEFEEEQQRQAEERRIAFERQQQEYEAERARKAELLAQRTATFERILNAAPTAFSATQFRVFLRLLVNLDPYTFVDDVAEHFAIEHEDSDKTSEELLLSALDALTDDKLTGFALRLVLTQHHPIPREGEVDFLTEAETAFAPAQPTKASKPKKPKTALTKVSPKKNAAKKSAAA
jgi:ParB family transcriptional regulator, chromosome partitioning protein